jgi:transglutaminase-like putative cysteine protease
MATDGLRGGLTGTFSRAKKVDKLAVLTLLFVLLASAVTGMASVLTGPNWGLLLQSLFLGLLVGWGIALFRQSAWRATLIAIIFGFVYIFLFPGGLIGKAIPVLVEFFRLIPDGFAFLRGKAIDFASLIDLFRAFFSSAGIIMTRLQAWIVAFVEGQPTFDPVAAALVWNAFVWLIAAWAGWVIEARQNALLAVLPTILLSVSTLAYGGRTSFTLYLMLGSLLLLLAMVRQEKREQAWVKSGAAYPVKKGRQIIYVSLVVTLVLVLFSAFTSSISIRRIREWISEHTKPTAQQDNGDLGESLGIIPGSTAAPDVFKAVRNPGLPQEHLIGSGPELSHRVVMTVAVNDLTSISQGGQPLPLYWRSYTYDTYTGRGWRASETEPKFYDADRPIQADRGQGQVMIQQDVHPVEDLGGTVYATGEPMTIDFQSEAAWRSFDDLFGVQMEQTNSYHALSLIPLIDERTLRAAGQKYPDWIRKRYLALPSTVPDRVRALAVELTASEPTPYDRAKAIERYLRTFPYSLDVPHPPSSRDVADYFLFDLKQGYCDYYATTMVVLTRAAGVPARLAMGYANGTYNLNSKRFVVTEADAHSWVEIYFPDIGWVPFEPTASRPQLEREKQPIVVQPLTSSPPVVSQGRTTSHVWRWLFGGVGAAGILGLLWVLFDEIWLHRMTRQTVAVEIYQRIRRFGKSLDMDSSLSDTPYEFTASLITRLQELGFQNMNPGFTSGLFRDLQTMTDEIVWTNYRPSQPDSVFDSNVLQHWRSLYWKLRWLWILNYERKCIDYVSRIRGMKMEQEKKTIWR